MAQSEVEKVCEIIVFFSIINFWALILSLVLWHIYTIKFYTMKKIIFNSKALTIFNVLASVTFIILIVNRLEFTYYIDKSKFICNLFITLILLFLTFFNILKLTR